MAHPDTRTHADRGNAHPSWRRAIRRDSGYRGSQWLAYLLLAFLLVGAGPLLAQPTVLLRTSGDAPEPVQQELTELLADLVQANPSLELLDHRNLTVEDALGLLGYTIESPEFIEDLISSLEGQRILYAKTRDTGGAVEVLVTWYDAEEATYLLDEMYSLNTEQDFIHLEAQLTAAISGRAVLEVTSSRTDVDIFLDSTAMGRVPVIVLGLAQGSHSLVATCPGCEPLTRSVEISDGAYHYQHLPMAGQALAPDLASGDRETRVMRLEPSEMAIRTEPGAGDGRDLVLPVTVTGLGVAMMGTGLVFALLTRSAQEDLDRQISYSRARELADEGETYALLTNVFLIAGAAVTAGGAVLFVLEPDREPSDRQPEASAAGLQGWIAPDGIGLMFQGSFY